MRYATAQGLPPAAWGCSPGCCAPSTPGTSAPRRCWSSCGDHWRADGHGQRTISPVRSGEQIVMGSPETEPQDREQDPYWTDDTSLFEGAFRYTHNAPTTVRARLHVEEEAYRLEAADPESSRIAHTTGTRSYIM